MKQLLEADQLVTMLAEATGRKLSPEGFMAYEIALSDVPLVDLNRAAFQLLRSSKFMPSPSEIREAAGIASGQVASKDRPTLAWTEARRAISRVGSYESPNFQDKTIHATLKRLFPSSTWPTFCEQSPEQLVWIEKEFKTLYAILDSTELPASDETRLAGICEIENGTAASVAVTHIGCLSEGGNGVKRLSETPSTNRPVANIAVESFATRMNIAHEEHETSIAKAPSVNEQLAGLRRLIHAKEAAK